VVEEEDDDEEGLGEGEGEDEPGGYHSAKYKTGSRKRLGGRTSDLAEAKARRSRYESWKDRRFESEAAEHENGQHSRRYAPRKGRQRLEDPDPGRRASKVGKVEEPPRKMGRAQTTSSSGKWRNSRPTLWDKGEVLNEADATEDEEDEETEADADEEDELVDANVWAGSDSGRELDNDFYKNDAAAKPPLRTYDDIIRRLTEDVATTTAAPTLTTTTATTTTTTSTPMPRPTTQVVKRDYRNTEIERHLRRDDYGNLRFYDLKKDGGSGRPRHPTTPAPRSSNHLGASPRASRKKALAAVRKDAARAVVALGAEEEEEEEEEHRVKAGGGDDDSGTQADANTVSPFLLPFSRLSI
jgi:hypothetical protein